MISIRNSVDDLDRCTGWRDLAVACYQLAIRNIAHYSVDLEPDVTAQHRKYLEELAASVTAGPPELEESRATLRGLLRDYRDKTGHYLNGLKEQLSETARALQEILESIGQADGNHDQQLRKAIGSLRTVPAPAGSDIANAVLGAARTIEDSLDQVKKQHQLTVSQFLMEIRMLHKRIDALEKSAAVDSLTNMFTRDEVEARIRAMKDAPFCLLLIKITGFKTAELQHGREVADELAGAFSKRFRNSLPAEAIFGRWNPEEFLAVLTLELPVASALAKKMAPGLAGPYACLKAGKTVRPALNLKMAIVDRGRDSVDRVIQRVGEFLEAA